MGGKLMQNNSNNNSRKKLSFYFLAIIIILTFFYFNTSKFLTENYSLPKLPIEINPMLVNLFIFMFLLLFLPYKKSLVWKTKVLFATFFVSNYLDFNEYYPLSNQIKKLWINNIGIKFTDLKIPFIYRIRNFYNSLVISTWDWAEIISYLSGWLIFIGLILIIIAFFQIIDENKFYKKGLYKFMRHPQYSGIILLITGWILWKTTIVSLIIYPIIIYSYYRLAIKEEIKLKVKYGMKYWEYFDKTPMFNPFAKIFN